MASFIRRLPFFSSGAASSVPVEPQRTTDAGYAFLESSPLECARVLEENLFRVLSDKFSEASVKMVVSAIHSPIDQTRFSKSTTNLPFTFRMKREKNGAITLFIHGKILLGSGNYKKVKDAVEVTITAENECSARDIVIQRLKKEILPGVIDISIERLRKIEKKHSENKSGERFKVGPSMTLHHYKSKNNLLRVEIIQERLEGNLSTVKDLTPKEKLSVLIDVADGLSQIHHAGYIHCDVKPDNIFIDFKRLDTERKGYISDLDLMMKNYMQTEFDREMDYLTWDHLAESGIFTQNTDVYGLALSAAEAFFPKSSFFNIYKFILQKELKKPSEKILLKLLKEESSSREAYLNFKMWSKTGKRKSKEQINVKLNELFETELKLINIFKREFYLSLNYYKTVSMQIKICKKNNTRIALEEILQKSATDLNMSTTESLKNEFIEILRTLGGRSPAASSVAVDPA